MGDKKGSRYAWVAIWSVLVSLIAHTLLLNVDATMPLPVEIYLFAFAVTASGVVATIFGILGARQDTSGFWLSLAAFLLALIGLMTTCYGLGWSLALLRAGLH